MANRQVLLSTHLHKHRKVVRSTTLRSATVIWAVYTHQRGARSKRKRIAISRDSILRSPISCVLTKLTQPPVNSLSDGRRTRGIRCTAGRLCTTKFVKSHHPPVYSTICELLGGKFKLQA